MDQSSLDGVLNALLVALGIIAAGLAAYVLVLRERTRSTPNEPEDEEED